MNWQLLPLLLAAGCALNAELPPDNAGMRASSGVSTHCASGPDAEVGKFRHLRNRMVAKIGDPRHRGNDLIAVESDEKQTVSGKLAYTAADKDLEGEDVWLFACVDDEWKPLGTSRTDKAGRFGLTLTSSSRLPAGMRDLYAHVVGDGTGVRFLAYVAKLGESVIVSDIDGTITESENAIINTVLFGDDIGHRRGAPQTFAQSGRTIVYLSSRGDQYTEVTRRWLRAHGFPPGPIRLARAAITKPGKHTVEFKTQALRAFGVPIHAAIGNKPSDVESYTNVGVPAGRIFVKLPEFETDLREDLEARRATGFNDYRALPAMLR